MPLQRRLPKYGFRSQKANTRGEVRLDALARLAVGEEGSAIDLAVIKAHRLVDRQVRRVKVIASGTLDAAVVLRGLDVTRGARAAIEAAGGHIED
jgi:large subunit ribosomal protein L15